MKELLNRIKGKWSIVLKVLPLLIVVVVLKIVIHMLSFEVLDLNNFFTTLVAGVIFLLGFLIAGVLSDYKESEKLPSYITSSFEALFDESRALFRGRNSETAKKFIEYQKVFISSLTDWFYEKETTQSILNKLSKMSDFLAGFVSEGVEASYVTIMENNLTDLRSAILRAATIRDTEFVSPAYIIVEIMGLLLSFVMLFIKIEPLWGAIFYNVLTTLLIFYVLFLMMDLDNPFEYSTKGEGGTEIPLDQIYDLKSRVEEFKL